MNKMNKKDLVLISFFRKNARESLTKISRQTQIPVSTIFGKLKNFEQDFIKKHTSIVDFKKLGFDLRLNIMFKVAKDEKEKFQEFLMKNFFVNSVFKINNGFDFLAEVVFRNMEEMGQFSSMLEEFTIIEKKDFFVIEDIKRESFLADRIQAELMNAA